MLLTAGPSISLGLRLIFIFKSCVCMCLVKCVRVSEKVRRGQRGRVIDRHEPPSVDAAI